MKIPRNPYLNRAMLRHPKAFYGRRKEFARLAARIASDPPQSVAIVGDRRIGKSSLLSYASHPDVVPTYIDTPERTLFLFVDFQEERRPTVADFYENVFRHLRGALKGRDEVPEAPSYDGMRQVLERLDHNGFKVILLLDEFDRVTRSSSFDPTFFGHLRSLAGHHNISYVTSSGRDLQQLCHTQEIADSPFFNIFSTIHLGPLEPDDAHALIREPSSLTPIPLIDHSALILGLGGYLPFFLQAACSAAFEAILEDGECRPEQVTARFMEEARPHFAYYWEQFDPVERAICNDHACGSGTDAERSEYQSLLKRGFVLDDGRLFSTAFASFVRESYAEEAGEKPVEVQAERMRSMEKELDTARKMQMGLLPKRTPPAKGLDITGRCVPASYVGGDFFSYLWLDSDQTRLCIAAVDVMGKEMEAAVTAVRCSEIVRYEARGQTAAGQILGRLNRALHGSLASRAFVTCCVAVLDLRERRVDLGVAGHCPPLHYRRSDDAVAGLDVRGFPLGLQPDVAYEGLELSLEKGDVILIYSDGITEARDDRRNLYSEERLADLLLEGVHEGLSADALLGRIFWDVGRFSASLGQEDDMTAIVVRVLE